MNDNIDTGELLSRVDILDYISQYCDLEERSDGEFWGLSPFKNERTPSFSVNKDKQRFYDFSSGIGGDLINFVQQYHHCDFPKALDIIKSYGGVTDGQLEHPKRLTSASIAKRYSVKDKKPTPAHETIPEDFMDRYEYSIEPMKPWLDEGITVEALIRFGVKYDAFANRIVFPIRDYSGHIISVSGRTLDPDYKAKGLRKYTYYSQIGGKLDTIYGYAENRKYIADKHEIILFEGAKSVMLAYGWGICNTGAVLTSHLSREQFLFLAALGCDVVFALDKEIDVTKDKQIIKLGRYVNVSYICDKEDLINEKMSPVDKGREVFEKLYGERRRL